MTILTGSEARSLLESMIDPETADADVRHGADSAEDRALHINRDAGLR